MNNKKVFIAGHNGMVGSAVLQELKHSGYSNIVTKTKKELNLLDQKAVESFFCKERPDFVVNCAARVGGILANNSKRADFIYENTQISTNIIHYSWKLNVQKLINLGSSCIYPKESKIPIKEEYLLSSSLENTNEPYAIAKINALKMCEAYYNQYNNNFYSLMPCNLFGEKDNFDLNSSHVLPAIIRKVHEAKINKQNTIEVWGSGKPLREFLYTKDLARVVSFCLEKVNAKDIYSQGISCLNAGSDDEVSILDLTKTIMEVLNFDAKIILDKSKPDGTYRKKMDNTRLKSLGFKYKYSLEQALKNTYDFYINNYGN